MVSSRHVQSGNFTPSIQQMRGYKLLLCTCPRQQRAVGAFSRPIFTLCTREKNLDIYEDGSIGLCPCPWMNELIS